MKMLNMKNKEKDGIQAAGKSNLTEIKLDKVENSKSNAVAGPSAAAVQSGGQPAPAASNGAQEGPVNNENDLSMTSEEDNNVDNNLMEGIMKQAVSTQFSKKVLTLFIGVQMNELCEQEGLV